MLKRLREKIDKFEVISFDIFDTAVFRTVDTPARVFNIVAKLNNIDELEFRLKRIRAEKMARDDSKGSEITLEEIYNKINIKSNSLKKCLINTERIVESKICVRNDEIFSIYMYCIQKIKK